MLKLKLLFTLIVALGLVPASSMAGEVSEIVISVKGLACPFCVYGLEKKLKKVDGVQGVEIDLNTGAAVVALKNGQAPDLAQFRNAVKKAGFTAGEIKITAVGKIVFTKNQALLKLSDSGKEYVLFEKDGAGAETLTVNTRQKLMGFAEKGVVLSMTGTVHEHADGPPGLSLDKVEQVLSK